MLTLEKTKAKAGINSRTPNQETEIPLAAIADSPYQLRQSHAQDLEGLRDTLVSHGLLQAVVVRPLPPKGGTPAYELLAGHRRCAAARLAGWSTIRARIQETSDDQAREIVVIENLLRKDLSAIEEARGFEAMLKSGHYATQEALAARVGCTQGHVANRLRYLRLPGEWQAAIISGEIPHTYARAILPYCDDPRAAAAIAKVRKTVQSPKGKQAGNGEARPPIDYKEFCCELATAFDRSGFEVGRYHSEHDKKLGRWISLPEKLTAEQRARLDIVTVKAEGRYGETVHQVARNRGAWFEIAREHARKEEARRSSRGAGKAAKQKPAEERTPAERKAAAAEEAKNRKKRQEQLARRRREIAADWKRLLIGRDLADPKRPSREVLMVCMMHMTSEWNMRDYRITGDWGDEAKAITGAEDLLGQLAAGKLDEAKIWDVARAYAVRAFVDPDAGDEGGPAPMSMIVSEDFLDYLIDWLMIDLRAEWAAAQMGSLSEAWWQAHDRDQLATIGSGIVNSNMKKGEMVDTLVKSRDASFPDELRSSKGKRKPR